MSYLTKRMFTFMLIGALLIISCQVFFPDTSQTDEPPPTVRITEVPVETEVETPTETSLPTEIPPTEPPPTEIPQISQSELIEKWRAPFVMTSIVAASCNSLLETADRVQTGEIDGFEAFGELLVAGLFLTAAQEGIAEWSPLPDQIDYKENILEHIDNIRSVLGLWIDEEITSQDIPDSLGGECEAIEETGIEIAEHAQEQGITEESLSSIIDEMEVAIDEWVADFEETDSDESIPDVPSETGLSRSNPFDVMEKISVPDWDIEVLDFLRGDDAWRMIEATNMFNDPAPEYMEYVLVNLRVINTTPDDEEHTIASWDFSLTGSHLIKYDSASVLAPEPELYADLFSGGETVGWIPFAIGGDENNLILTFEGVDDSGYSQDYFFALEEGASIEIPPELIDIEPTELGTSRAEPAPNGEPVTSEDWTLSIVEVIRGDEAWQLIQVANEFNDPPADGMEYILVKVEARYIGDSSEAVPIDNYSFESTGSANVLYDPPYVIPPVPTLDAYLYPGGQHEGWIVLLAESDEKNIMAVFTPWADWDDENRRFLFLE